MKGQNGRPGKGPTRTRGRLPCDERPSQYNGAKTATWTNDAGTAGHANNVSGHRATCLTKLTRKWITDHVKCETIKLLGEKRGRQVTLGLAVTP